MEVTAQPMIEGILSSVALAGGGDVLLVVILLQREHKRCVGQWRPCKRDQEDLRRRQRNGVHGGISRERGRGLWRSGGVAVKLEHVPYACYHEASFECRIKV